MTDDYYAPHPLLRLPRPLVLIAHPGAEIDAIGRSICGRTGLPFNDVPRSTEAVAGAARARVAEEQGVDALRAIELKALDKAVRRQPRGVVVFESSLLGQAACASALDDRADVAFVARPMTFLWQRFALRGGVAGRVDPDFPPPLPTDAAAFAAQCQVWEEALPAEVLRIEGGRAGAGRIANHLIEALEPVWGAESLLR